MVGWRGNSLLHLVNADFNVSAPSPYGTFRLSSLTRCHRYHPMPHYPIMPKTLPSSFNFPTQLREKTEKSIFSKHLKNLTGLLVSNIIHPIYLSTLSFISLCTSYLFVAIEVNPKRPRHSQYPSIWGKTPFRKSCNLQKNTSFASDLQNVPWTTTTRHAALKQRLHQYTLQSLQQRGSGIIIICKVPPAPPPSSIWSLDGSLSSRKKKLSMT